MPRQAAWTCPLLILLGPGALFAAPLVDNGDFSSATGTGAPEGWAIPPGLAGMAKVVDDDGHSGSISLRFGITEGTKAEVVSQRVACEPNTEYVLSAWLKSPDLLPSVQVTGDGNRIVHLDLTDQERWQPLSARFNSGRLTELLVVIFPHASEGAMPAGTAWVDDVQVTPAAEFEPEDGQVAGGYAGPAPGPNIALNKPYTLAPGPNYSYCTEPGDATQLTDGEYSVGYFWTQKSTVGWTNQPYADITIDLGQVYPIKGCSYNTAAGVAGVTWPSFIAIFVSEDGQTWYRGGDLVGLSARFGLPPDDQYATHRFVADDLKPHGRYFRLMVAGSGPYTFVDEIEVYEGPEELLQADLGAPVTEQPPDYLISQRVAAAVRNRLLKDLAAFRQEASAESVSDATKTWAETEVGRLTEAVYAAEFSFPADWRAIHPLVPLHAEIYKARARVKRELGVPSFVVWQKPRWDMLAPTEVPGAQPPRSRVAIHALSGEYRAEAVNMTNMSDTDLRVEITADRLPGGAHPDYLAVHQVEWIETQAGIPVADALPLAEETARGWQVTVPSGMTRQAWLTFQPTGLAAGVHEGSLAFLPSLPDAKATMVPVQLRVYPLKLPERLSCSLGMWDYSCTKNYDLTDQNVDAAIVNMREHFLDTPWNDAGCVPWPQSFDAEGNLVGELDWSRFDGWVADWDGATNYAVFLAVSTSIGGVKMDDPHFPKAVGEWMHAWAEHLRELEVKPSQLMLLLVDEPSTQEPADIITAWANAINAAEPDIVVWEDPTYSEPGKLTDIAMFEASDVLCPNLGIFGGGTDAHREFYEKLRQQGKTLWFYQCSGPAKTHDPYYYHRLQHWYAFKYGATGSGFWAYGDAAGVGTSWNELRAARNSFTPVYLDENSVTDGKHFEAVREGLEDYELLRMLRDHADKLAAEGKQQRADQARKLLQTVIDDVCGAGYEPAKIPWIVDKDRTRADAARVRMLEELARG